MAVTAGEAAAAAAVAVASAAAVEGQHMGDMASNSVCVVNSQLNLFL
jgi:hypothetical protein